MEERSRSEQPTAIGNPADPLQEQLQQMIGTLIEALIRSELDAALGVTRYGHEAAARRGYRHASRRRTLTTSVGTTTLRVPRARLFTDQANVMVEWQSQLLPRYRRRARAVDETVLGAYLAGTNTRRIQRALAPLLGRAPLSKSAVSRVMRTLRERFEAWRSAPLNREPLAYLFLDGIVVKVRVDRRVQTVPVLVAVGVTDAGEKRLLALQLMGSESRAAWRALVEDLVDRGLPTPALVVIDGNPGVRHAVAHTWPQTAVQRCIVHKLRNLEAHAPKRCHDEIRAQYHAITEAERLTTARAAFQRFVRTWRRRAPAVARSLEEGGDELLTFFRLPRSQWKCVRTTNIIERIHEEFRRRIKTQASHPLESSVVRLLFALVQSGQLRMRRLDGWYDIPRVLAQHRTAAA